MESIASMTCPPVSAVVLHGAAPAAASAAYQGTGLPVAGSGWTVARTAVTPLATSVRPISSLPGTASPTYLLPISDVVVFDGLAGIRAWSPPV